MNRSMNKKHTTYTININGINIIHQRKHKHNKININNIHTHIRNLTQNKKTETIKGTQKAIHINN